VGIPKTRTPDVTAALFLGCMYIFSYLYSYIYAEAVTSGVRVFCCSGSRLRPEDQDKNQLSQ
jgi:hypothetical protein